MKKAILVVAITVLALAQSSRADFIDTFNIFPQGNAIPDGNLAGWSDTRTVGFQPGDTTKVTVGLNLNGAYNGDLYAYLVHSSGFAVLLNRVGRGTGPGDSEPGFSTSGMNVFLASDAMGANIHDVSSPASGGTFQADGRNISPLASVGSFDSGFPIAALSSFTQNGDNAAGNWTLFIADVAAGDTHTINSWTLEIAAVPEPASWLEGAIAVLFLGGVIGLYRLKGAGSDPLSRRIAAWRKGISDWVNAV